MRNAIVSIFLVCAFCACGTDGGDADIAYETALKAIDNCGNCVLESQYGEECDDGNKTPQDGCSASCKIEGDEWECPLCESCQECGNGIKEWTEECDDGNTAPNDGCDDGCDLEPGWTCCVPGSPCSYCGDGDLELCEECDDGNTMDDDGCDSECEIELGWYCPTPGQACLEVCGDCMIVGEEECEDDKECVGGMNPGAFCMNDTHCYGGTCEPVNGDGCDDECQIEDGWACSEDCAPCWPL
jgi:cysteine-rich repeat protein